MALDEATLTEVAQNGEMDYTKWPSMIEPLLERLNHIVYHEFPLPRPYTLLTPNVSTSSETPQQTGATLVTQTPTTPRTLPPVPPFPGSTSSTSQISNSQPEASQAAHSSETDKAPPAELPIILAQLFNSITNTLQTSFSTKPPHTIQRLAELVLYPNGHYKTLPAYLRALDRVVSVSSTADIFPLSDQPSLVNGTSNGETGGGILWKIDTNGNERGRENDLGSDESLGGALLTPIPWLRDINPGEGDPDFNSIEADTDNDLLDPLTRSDSAVHDTGVSADSSTSPHARSLATSHHDPLVPERQDGAVTQGELIRMEQEAGVVPVTHSSQSNPVRSLGRSEPISNSIALGVGIGLDDLEDDEDDISGAPHARGPDMLGTVDMGLVGGRDLQVSIGSPPDDGIRERFPPVDVNDAQEVLEGSEANEAATRRKGSDGEDSYVDVGKELDDVDAMQIDSIEGDGVDASTQDKKKDDDMDEDIVLVDADGLTEGEREKVDEIGGQEGNDAGDTTR